MDDAAPFVQRQCAVGAETTDQGRVNGAALARDLGDGRGLDAGPREQMQSAFGTNFGEVRIHDDERGAQWARRLGAQAFTLGSHVVFARGMYRPGTSAGDRLLAHELTHTLQQRGGGLAVQRATAGGCADAEVDEQRDELSRVGILAHQQIQQRFRSALHSEVRWPRATKEIRGDACPPATRLFGKFDFWLNGSNWGEIGEIKSVEGEAWGARDLVHYRQRAEEMVGRLRRGTPCAVEQPPNPFDVERDTTWFGGRIRRNGLQPEFRPLARGVPTTPTRLGPFWGNPRKNLSCERHENGVVVYWCTPGARDEDRQRQAQRVAVPEQERRTETARRPQAVRVMGADPLFTDVLERIPPTMMAPGRRFVIAIDSEVYTQRQRQREQEEMQRRMRMMQIDPRGVPFIQLTAPLIPLAVLAGTVELVLLIGAVVAVAVLAAPEVAAATAVTTAATATTATTTAAVTTTTASAGAVYTTATGVTLTVIEGGGAAATTTTVASIVRGSAAAASFIAAITAAGEANAQEAAAPYLDRPLVLVRDVTGVQDVGRTVTAAGRTFRVIALLSSESP